MTDASRISSFTIYFTLYKWIQFTFITDTLRCPCENAASRHGRAVSLLPVKRSPILPETWHNVHPIVLLSYLDNPSCHVVPGVYSQCLCSYSDSPSPRQYSTWNRHFQNYQRAFLSVNYSSSDPVNTLKCKGVLFFAVGCYSCMFVPHYSSSVCSHRSTEQLRRGGEKGGWNYLNPPLQAWYVHRMSNGLLYIG